jgi:hypothetical protein
VRRGKPVPVGVVVLGALLASAPLAAQQTGVELVGRWLSPASLPTATYAGSMVLLSFKHSAHLWADLDVANSRGSQELFISVSVDGGIGKRMGLSRGRHAGVPLASGLSAGPHLVVVRKEGEPHFGALQFAHPRLDVAGRWQPIEDDRPLIEVIGDSDATGICALGPDSPADAVGIYNSSWASEAVSWVGLLEAGLAGVGHPVDMVDLAISGSTTASEARFYDDTAPGYSDALFTGYAPPGRRHASLVFLWGGANDHRGGGEVAALGAAAAPLSYANLSPFQRGVYDQLTKVFARNPDVRVVLLEYIDAAIPGWRAAYEQVRSLFSQAEQQRMFMLRVFDPPGAADACEIDPRGHPNLFMHTTWAAQILRWMLAADRLTRLGFPPGAPWSTDQP